MPADGRSETLLVRRAIIVRAGPNGNGSFPIIEPTPRCVPRTAYPVPRTLYRTAYRTAYPLPRTKYREPGGGANTTWRHLRRFSYKPHHGCGRTRRACVSAVTSCPTGTHATFRRPLAPTQQMQSRNRTEGAWRPSAAGKAITSTPDRAPCAAQLPARVRHLDGQDC